MLLTKIFIYLYGNLRVAGKTFTVFGNVLSFCIIQVRLVLLHSIPSVFIEERKTLFNRRSRILSLACQLSQVYMSENVGKRPKKTRGVWLARAASPRFRFPALKLLPIVAYHNQHHHCRPLPLPSPSPSPLPQQPRSRFSNTWSELSHLILSFVLTNLYYVLICMYISVATTFYSAQSF